MLQKLYEARMKGNEESGFTLIELLVVIIILAILAAVVVFAVSGIGDKGQTSACKIDTRTIRTAEEAFFAAPVGTGGKKVTNPGQYGDETALVNEGFLSETSSYHNVTRVAAALGRRWFPRATPSRCRIPGVGPLFRLGPSAPMWWTALTRTTSS